MKRHPQEPSTHPAKPAATAADQAHSADHDEMNAEPNDAAADDVERLQRELEEAKDRALRTQAELDNYRKRSQREMNDALRYANINLMRDLLPVVDNLNRAAESAEKSTEKSADKSADVAALLAGVKMVASQFEDVLAQHHCKRITAHGEAFDPNLHEAIAQQPSDEHAHGMVLLEATTGFQLHDRVVRPTQVIVSGGPPGG
ncbi:MAG: nucleotide exchange factor GrpE [Pirellulales bacterium]